MISGRRLRSKELAVTTTFHLSMFLTPALRKYLASREFDIVVGLDQGVGVILVSGIRTVGKFTFEPSE